MAITLPWLTPDQIGFPPVEQALEEPNGLLCAGGDLSVPWLREAYARGIFPWYEEGQPILWWSPDPRCVLKFPDLYVSRSMARRLRQGGFRFTFDTNFDAVVTGCAEPRRRGGGTWITPAIQQAYGQLHRAGLAHSIEVWEQETLVGGLYGVSLGSLFFGESMFSRVTDASKAAFIVLARHLVAWGYDLLDCQVVNPHLLSLGAREVPRDHFLAILKSGLSRTVTADWQVDVRLTQ